MTDHNGKEAIARNEIKRVFGTPEGEDNVSLFVTHHLDELSSEEWREVCGAGTPSAQQILSSLALVSKWSSQDSEIIDIFDFSLPKNTTQYVISVAFDGDDISKITMES
ncbi:DUF2004 domain-containing protein [Loktanella sp. S4079]|uniref:DUF2004 domain-containing protein n=1 Tax=Loktanella sp. S4079 TaxID=579483 RepID=UPI0005FA20B7|nr:DUF2004 domain-containing protein [Loktanella sp. S4079]KJZ19805.1 hypothetical protein TW80_02650 [Loktanella sp. S4079]